MSTEEWLTELCPEIAEWQIELIAEHIEQVRRTAYNDGYDQGQLSSNQFDDQYQTMLRTAREATK